MDLLNKFATFKVKESQYKQCGVTFPPGKIYWKKLLRKDKYCQNHFPPGKIYWKQNIEER